MSFCSAICSRREFSNTNAESNWKCFPIICLDSYRFPSSIRGLGSKLLLWWLSDSEKSVFMCDANTVLLITNEIICQIQFWYMARVVRVWIDLMRIRAEKRPLKAFFNTEPRPCQFSVNQSKNFFLIFKSENTMAKVKIFILQYGKHRYSSW